MIYKKIPNTDLNASVISLGTWAFGGDNWGSVNESECIEAVRTGIELGINLIDTAPIYGNGVSEKVVKKAIKGIRDKVIIATKCGLIKQGSRIKNNLKSGSIRAEVDDSLKRLGVECIDLYQCHWPDQDTPIEETMQEMLRMKNQGKIRYIGVSNFDLELLKRAKKVVDIASVQNHYSLLERSIENGLLQFCREKGIGVLSYGSLGGGILSGKYESEKQFSKSDARSFFYKYYSGEGFKIAQKTIKVLNDISGRHGKPVNQVALNWIRQKSAVVSAIAGCKNAEQARANALAASWNLDADDMQKLDAINK